jgi:AraC-like DNA-binding protein
MVWADDAPMSPPSPTSPLASDPLGEALHHLRLSGALYCRSELTTPFAVAMPPLPGSLMFHIVTAGRCWLELEGHEALELRPGDLALVPHGGGHDLVSRPGLATVDLFDLEREHVTSCYEILRHGGGGEAVGLVCGAVDFDHPAARQLLAALPEVVHVDAWRASEAEWLQGTLRYMAAEARQLKPGGETIITRLCDILVVQAIRSWLAEAPAAQTGWLGALQDEQIGRAIAHVHRSPERPWTVAALAEKAAMSRSAFSTRFSALVGEAPMAYVTRWRMSLARDWLREGDQTTLEIALRLGYQSEAAFSRAFKRTLGLSPGRARREVRGSPLATAKAG